MQAISGLKLVRYGALMSLSYDRRQVFMFAEHISVSEENATYFTLVSEENAKYISVSEENATYIEIFDAW